MSTIGWFVLAGCLTFSAFAAAWLAVLTPPDPRKEGPGW